MKTSKKSFGTLAAIITVIRWSLTERRIMRFRRKTLWSAVVLSCLTANTGAQGTFQNLDFESAALVPIPGDPYGRVQFAPAFPGWTGSVGGSPETAALYNNLFLDSSGISTIDGSFPYPGIQGNFAAVLQAGNRLFTTEPADTALAQTGVVPLGTESLQFRVAGGVVVTLAGQYLPLTPLESGTGYTLYGSDIHAWQGQTAELRFTVLAERPHINNRYVYLDSIQFSNQPIPEPSVFGLFALGALLLGGRFFKGTSRAGLAERNCG